MANSYGIPADVEQRIRARDTKCVYCEKSFSLLSRRDWPTIEHLNENPPFRWKQGRLSEAVLAICCWSCNASRGKKSLNSWFRTPYCLNRINPISENTVAAVVRDFLRSAR